MKILAILCVFLLFSSPASTGAQIHTILAKVRVTYYDRFEKGGYNLACSNHLKPKEGVSVAAHPSFPFGTRIRIPYLNGIIGDGNFIVQDRGSAVSDMKASKGYYLVFDVYFEAKNQKEADKRMLWLEKNIPDYLEVIIFE